MPGMPAQPTVPPGTATKPAAEKHDAHGGHCPGHGPMDPPGHINWYQGLAGVDNDKAINGTAAEKLFWRYKNPLDECDPKNQEPPVLAAVINLAVVLYLLVRFGKGPVKDALAKRKKTLMSDIDSAHELKTDAEKRLASYEKQLARIEERQKELHAEYRTQWEAEKKRILAEAEDKSSRLRKDAEFRVAQELKQAQADLLQDAVDGALAAAEELMKKRIQDADQSRLADEYVAGVAAALSSGIPAQRGTGA
jgi:F-type H+-transporting ATPase subunit b